MFALLLYFLDHDIPGIFSHYRLLLPCVFICFVFETGFHYLVLHALELNMYARLASNLEDSLVCAFQVLELKVQFTLGFSWERDGQRNKLMIGWNVSER